MGKVFCHEEEAKAVFDEVNDELFYNAEKANRYANMLMPILGNIGNVLYVIVAIAGGAMYLANVPNLSISGLAFSISILIPFLNMTKQFAGSIGQVSNQLNSVIMGLAGAKRIFDLMDEQVETDEGYVTLVNAKEGKDGSLTECSERTNLWAWKHPHSDGTVTYTAAEEGSGRYAVGEDLYQMVEGCRELAMKAILPFYPEARLCLLSVQGNEESGWQVRFSYVLNDIRVRMGQEDCAASFQISGGEVTGFTLRLRTRISLST